MKQFSEKEQIDLGIFLAKFFVINCPKMSKLICKELGINYGKLLKTTKNIKK